MCTVLYTYYILLTQRAELGRLSCIYLCNQRLHKNVTFLLLLTIQVLIRKRRLAARTSASYYALLCSERGFLPELQMAPA
jgi:hypothetical protein